LIEGIAFIFIAWNRFQVLISGIDFVSLPDLSRYWFFTAWNRFRVLIEGIEFISRPGILFKSVLSCYSKQNYFPVEGLLGQNLC